MRAILAGACLSVMHAVLAAPPALAQQQTDAQSVAVGPWVIATTYKADRFENCTMTRSVADLRAMFIRNRDGLLLTLDSSNWRLDRGKAYTVKLSTGSRSTEARALAESRSVTIALADAAFNDRLRIANTLDVVGEGTTLRVPLDGSAAGLERLDLCFDKNMRESPDTNPFVAPARKP